MRTADAETFRGTGRRRVFAGPRKGDGGRGDGGGFVVSEPRTQEVGREGEAQGKIRDVERDRTKAWLSRTR